MADCRRKLCGSLSQAKAPAATQTVAERPEPSEPQPEDWDDELLDENGEPWDPEDLEPGEDEDGVVSD